LRSECARPSVTTFTPALVMLAGAAVVTVPTDVSKLGVNFWGVINGVHAFTQAMIEQKTPGAIVNTGSKHALPTFVVIERAAAR
jgi:hypothetical protein